MYKAAYSILQPSRFFLQALGACAVASIDSRYISRVLQFLLSASLAMSQTAVSLKDQGNKAFAVGDWPTAIAFYTQAIDVDASEPTFFTNRAQVREANFPSTACQASCD